MLSLNLYTPYGKFIELQDIAAITLPGSEGEIGILPGHMPLITTIVSGILTYLKDSREHKIAIHHGFVEISDDKVQICTVLAERAEDVNVDRAQTAFKRASERLEDFFKKEELGDVSYNKLQSKLSRSLTRINIIGGG